MGNAGEKPNHANHFLQVVNGVDRGNGYQGYMAVSYALEQNYLPESAKAIIRRTIKKNGYSL